LNPNKEGVEAPENEKEDLSFVPDEDVLEDLRKEMGIPEEEIIKTQLENSNKIEEEAPNQTEGEAPEKPGTDSKDIQEESQEKPKKE
jgi:hypothetical protein